MSNRTKLLILLALVIVLAGAFELRVRKHMVDFSVNYQAAERLRRGETMYRPSDGHYQFKYMPFSAFLYLPFSLLPLGAAKAAWYVVVVTSTGLIFFLTVKLLRVERTRAATAIAVTGAVLARYFLREIDLGQINALMTSLLLFMVLSYDPPALGPPDPEPGDKPRTGLFWGLATALKPYALIYLPYFVIRRKWRAAAAGGLFLGVAVLAPALFYGPRGNFAVLGEWRTTLSASTPRLYTTQDNVSLMGFLSKWTGGQALTLGLYAAVLAALAGLFLALMRLGKKIERPHILEGFLLLALIPLVSPLGWDYTMLSAAPALMLVVSRLDRYPRPARVFLFVVLGIVALSLFDVMGRASYGRFMSLSLVTPCFLIIVGYVSYLRLKGHA